MKAVYRLGLWESNSSTVHAYASISEEEFYKWKDGRYLFFGTFWDCSLAQRGRIYSKEEVLHLLKEKAEKEDDDKLREVIKKEEDNISPSRLYNYGFYTFENCDYFDEFDIVEPSDKYQIIYSSYDG